MRPPWPHPLPLHFPLSGQGACENCFEREPFDLYVDVTAALRAAGIRPSSASLHCLVEDEDEQLKPIEDTPVPPPLLRGPRFQTMDASDADADDVAALQRELIKWGVKETDVVDGQLGPKTTAAIKAFQLRAGLVQECVAAFRPCNGRVTAV